MFVVPVLARSLHDLLMNIVIALQSLNKIKLPELKRNSSIIFRITAQHGDSSHILSKYILSRRHFAKHVLMEIAFNLAVVSGFYICD